MRKDPETTRNRDLSRSCPARLWAGNNPVVGVNDDVRTSKAKSQYSLATACRRPLAVGGRIGLTVISRAVQCHGQPAPKRKTPGRRWLDRLDRDISGGGMSRSRGCPV
ncbi:hypothetical protein HMPREF0298_0232 [Corynebacterium lipophiloflavum DSM 44291]|uniref:Uncharacterized protein n=1 Tax=Corynebacterium lipophiloflavum (strain ATCC 700352 / DSM 44291 / CCUG 37336 / JCM 10383 / DMMZ 1944) TaxID=525263 RepID=C0XP62_CORLD|nr:hypothetical protein HMPREF0298_0232 [Corynebacterium lipophiloflavum DSM 44291]